MDTTSFKSFHYLENGDISFSQLDTLKTEKKLERGVYNLSYAPYPQDKILLSLNKDLETTKIHSFPDRDRLDNLFNSFFDKKIQIKMNKLGFNHKVGVLLYGKEGTGKSTIVKHYYNSAIESHNAIVFNVATDDYISNCWKFISEIRKIQDNPIIVVLEEIDGLIKNYEATLKTLLDGNLSIDNCIFFGTTNYIDVIPAALKDRPSRFKYVLNVEGVHGFNDIYPIVNNMLGDIFGNEDVSKFCSDLKGHTLDSIKQFCVDKIMDIKTYSHKKNGVIGFFQKQVNGR